MIFASIHQITAIFLPLEMKVISSGSNAEFYVHSNAYWLVFWMLSNPRGIDCEEKNSIIRSKLEKEKLEQERKTEKAAKGTNA